MKKTTIILTAIVCMVAMVSCDPDTQQQIDADMATHITEFNYKGHRYMLYRSSYSRYAIAAVSPTTPIACVARKEVRNDNSSISYLYSFR